MTERFRTLAETTLAGNYTAASGTMTVTSAAAFPSTGVFRVRLGNVSRTVFRVDSVAGAVFTGVAESNDGNATTGDDVILVNSAGAMQSLIQPPAVGGAVGLYGVDGASFVGPLHRFTPLDQSGWSWDNQGAYTVTQAGGIVFLAGPLVGSTDVGVRFTTAPTPPYVITAAVIPIIGGGGFTYIAIGFRESGSGSMKLLIPGDDNGLHVINYTSPTSGGADSATRTPAFIGTPIWLQIEDDNTDVIFRYSTDGINFTQIFAEPRTTFITPDQVCIVASAQGSFDGVAGGSILHWLET